MSEKCFCHLNGLAVKDATARREIENIKSGIVTPEMFGAIGDGVTCDADAFINALRTGKKVVCDSSKTYYFSKPVDVREMFVGHLDGGNAHFINFHIYININDEFTSWRRGYGADRFIIENMFFGDRHDTIPEGWETPCITAGCPMIIKNIVSLGYPYVLAVTQNYIDFMLFEDWVCWVHWDLFKEKNLEIELDAISCLNSEGNYSVIENTMNIISGDSWRASGMQQYKSSLYPSYRFMRVPGLLPIIFESSIEISVELNQQAKVVFLGGHFESGFEGGNVFFNENNYFGTSLTFLGSYFHDTHSLIDKDFVTYINCRFEMVDHGNEENRTLAMITNNKSWYDLKCKLINCQFNYDSIIDTDTFNLYKKLPKKTNNTRAIYYGKIKDTNLNIFDNNWRTSIFPVNNGTYTYEMYTLTTSQPNIANEHKTFTTTLEGRSGKYVDFRIYNCIGGYGFIIIRKDNEGGIYKTEYYLEPNIENIISIEINDYGSFCHFRTRKDDIESGLISTPWVQIDSEPEFTINPNLYEANGILLTSDKSECNITNGQIVLNQYPSIEKTISVLDVNKNPGIYNFGYLDASGEFKEDSNATSSDFIKICGNNRISYFPDPSSPITPTNMKVYEYDEYQNFIKEGEITKIVDNDRINSYLLNENTKFIRLCTWSVPANPEDITGIKIGVYYTNEAVAEFIPYRYIDKTVLTPYSSGTNLRLISDEGSEYILGVDRDGTIITHKIKEG